MKRDFKIYIALLMMMFAVFIIVDIVGPDDQRKVFIDGDGSGHYAYLPTLIIFNTVDFTPVFEIEKNRRPPDYMGHYFHKHNDIYINKYTMGTALLQLPFFLIALLLSAIFGLPCDGYSIIFQYASAFSALFWLTIGIIFFTKLLRLYDIKYCISYLMAFILLFGTNLFFYSFVQPSFSHVYSFALITVFLYLIKKLFLFNKTRTLIASAFVLGLIFLVRPVNIVIVGAVPFLAGDYNNLLRLIKFKLKSNRILYATITFLSAISPQLIVNILQTGSPLVYGYQDEGFNFLNPHLCDFLFSYRKGWFVYSPIFLLLIPAIFYFIRKRRYFEIVTFILFFFVLVYLFSSWWNWFYGDSFGMRPMVDFYSLFFLIIAITIAGLKRWWFILLTVVFIVASITLNQIQIVQYARGIIHADSMTKDAYWYVFLKTDRKYSGVIGGANEYYTGVMDEKPFFTSYNNIDDYPKGWNASRCIDTTLSNSHLMSVRLTPDCIYCPALEKPISDTLIGYDNIYVKFSVDYLEKESNEAMGAVFVVSIGDKNRENLFYKAFKMKSLPDDVVMEWKNEEIGFKLPKITSEMDYIKLYIWNVNKGTFWLDNLKVEFYTYN